MNNGFREDVRAQLAAVQMIFLVAVALLLSVLGSAAGLIWFALF